MQTTSQPIWINALQAADCYALVNGQTERIEWKQQADCLSFVAPAESFILPFGVSLAAGETLEVRWRTGSSTYTITVVGGGSKRTQEVAPQMTQSAPEPEGEPEMELSSAEALDNLLALCNGAGPQRRRTAAPPKQTPPVQAQWREPRSAAPQQRCSCGACPKCREDERWERIFQEKFADPHYYHPPVVRYRSPLA
jgi:hypothetical protein